MPTIPKWQINGGYVLLENDTGTLVVRSGLFPCLGYLLRSMGLNATRIDGRKVILVTDFNQSLTGLPLMMTESHQTFDESTPAPIPAGQPAPPFQPRLADLSQPVVTVLAPLQSFAFSITTTPVTGRRDVQSGQPLSAAMDADA